MISEFNDRMHYRTFNNKWNNFMEIDYSFVLACSGIEAKQQQVDISGDRMTLSIGMSKWHPLDIDTYCNDQWMSM